MKKVTVKYNSNSPQGNIFWILAKVSEAMKKEGLTREFEDLEIRVTTSGSYNKALEEIKKDVNLIDMSTEKYVFDEEYDDTDGDVDNVHREDRY